MTDEEMPTPMPGEQRDRVAERRHRRPAAERRDDHDRDAASPPPARRCPPDVVALRDAVGEHDVGREQHRVGERERHAERLAGELHVGEQVDARHGERERGDVARACARRARPARSPAGTRSPRRCRAAAGRSPRRSSSSSPRARRPRRQQPAAVASARRTRARAGATAAKTAAAEAIRSQATPSTSHAREQQHRERRPEVVEDRADDEVGVAEAAALDGIASAMPGDCRHDRI